MIGGLANCTSCGKAAPVEGLRDPLWRLWKIAVFVLAVVLATGAHEAAGPAWGLGVLVTAMLVAWLVSRGF